MENKIINSGIKNIVSILLVQVVSLALSFLTAFILPNFLGVAQFGYWQIYLLYTSFVGVFCIGYNDGLYLRYGKYDYKDLPFYLLRSSMKLFLIMLLFLSFLMITLILIGGKSDKTFVFLIIAANIFVQGLSGTFSMVYLFTNRMKLYSVSTVLNKILLLISILTLIVMDIHYYKAIVVADLTIKIVVLLFNIYFCKELLFGKSNSTLLGFIEMKENMYVGISLMIANIMGMLVLGLGNFMVERFLEIEEYGYYAFAISSTNLTILFVSSVSLVLYPMLKRLPEVVIPYYYGKINIMLCIIIFCMLLLYFPVYWIVKNIMPTYSPILNYLYLLFPIVVVQGKIQLLINTYYKILREEKAMLKANISSVIIFLIITVPSFYIFRSVICIAICTLITMIWRCYASEIYLKKGKLKITSFINILEELTMIFLFIIFAAFENSILGLICYLMAIAVYFSVHFNLIKKFSSKVLKVLISNKSFKL